MYIGTHKKHNISVNKGITIIALKNFKHDYTYKISVNWDKLSKNMMKTTSTIPRGAV